MFESAGTSDILTLPFEVYKNLVQQLCISP